MRANRAAYEAITLRPSMGLDKGKAALATTVVGQPVSMPVLLAPCGFTRVVHPDGESGVARAAARAGTISVLSSVAGTDLEEVAAAAPDSNLWFQLYFLGGRRGGE